MVISAVLPPRTGWAFEFASSQENSSQQQIQMFSSPLQTTNNNSLLPVTPGPTKRKMNTMDRFNDSDEDEDDYDQPRLSGTRSVPASMIRNSNEMDLFSSSFQKRLSTGGASSSSPRVNKARIAKRPRMQPPTGHPLPVGRILESLDKKNLRNIIENLCQSHPYLVDEISTLAPRITVSTAIDHLKVLLSNIYNNLPFKGDQRGDYAYLRVRPAVDEFLNALADYTSNFLPPAESQPSNSLAFLDSATELLHELPVWSTSVNNHKQWGCYDDLSSAWTIAIREASKRAGGLGLVHDGWQGKLEKHNGRSGGRLRDAVNCIREELSWLNGEERNGFGGGQFTQGARMWT